MWQHYDADPTCRTDRGDLAVRMRSLRSYLRFQRNRLVETLLDEGKKPAEVLARVRADLCETCRRVIYGESQCGGSIRA